MTDTPAGWEDILDPGETILWHGRPARDIVWRDMLSMQSAMGVFFAGFAVFWIAMASSITGSSRRFGDGGLDAVTSFFPLFGIPFVLVGLYMVFGRLLWDAYVRSTSYYTLTNRAAYIATAVLGQRRLDRHAITAEMPLTLDDGQPGSIWFAERIVHHRGGWSGTGSNRRYSPPSTSRVRIGFHRIDDARSVYARFREARRAVTGDEPAEKRPA